MSTSRRQAESVQGMNKRYPSRCTPLRQPFSSGDKCGRFVRPSSAAVEFEKMIRTMQISMARYQLVSPNQAERIRAMTGVTLQKDAHEKTTPQQFLHWNPRGKHSGCLLHVEKNSTPTRQKQSMQKTKQKTSECFLHIGHFPFSCPTNFYEILKN